MIAGQSADQAKQEIQRRVVDLITKKLESGEMTPDRAKEIAAMILERMPESVSEQELIEIIPKLDDQFEELAQIIVPITLEYERKMREELNVRIDAHLKEKNFDQVLEITKQAIEQEKKLT